MQFTYDPKYNVAYLRFAQKEAEVETIKVSEDVLIDLSADGQIYGIELLNANKQLGQDSKKFQVLNKSTGKSVELPLA